jgi:hypothetical protein
MIPIWMIIKHMLKFYQYYVFDKLFVSTTT